MTNGSRLIPPVVGAALALGGAWPAAATAPERPTIPIFVVNRTGEVENFPPTGPPRHAKLDEVRGVLTVPAGGTFKSIDGIVHQWRSAPRHGCRLTLRAAAFAAAGAPKTHSGRVTILGHALPKIAHHGTATVPFLGPGGQAAGNVVVRWYLTPTSGSSAGQALAEFKLPTQAAPHANHRFIYLVAGATPAPDSPRCRSATRTDSSALARRVVSTFTGAATK